MKTIRFVNVQAVLSKFVSVVAENDNEHEVEHFGKKNYDDNNGGWSVDIEVVKQKLQQLRSIT